MRATMFIALLVLLTQVRPPTISRVLPVDEAVREPALVATRQRLIGALRAGDTATILSMMHPDVVLDGGASGRDEASVFFPRSEPADQLLRMLQIGGAFRKTPDSRLSSEMFCAPYSMAKFPSYDELPLDFHQGPDAAVILGDHVAIHKDNSMSSPIVGYLSHDIVLPWTFGSGGVFVGTVTKPDGAGWVERTQVWAKGEDYFACFGRFDGQWLITKFTRFPFV